MKKENQEKEQVTVENTGIQEDINENPVQEEQNDVKSDAAVDNDMQKELAELDDQFSAVQLDVADVDDTMQIHDSDEDIDLELLLLIFPLRNLNKLRDLFLEARRG